MTTQAGYKKFPFFIPHPVHHLLSPSLLIPPILKTCYLLLGRDFFENQLTVTLQLFLFLLQTKHTSNTYKHLSCYTILVFFLFFLHFVHTFGSCFAHFCGRNHYLRTTFWIHFSETRHPPPLYEQCSIVSLFLTDLSATRKQQNPRADLTRVTSS